MAGTVGVVGVVGVAGAVVVINEMTPLVHGGDIAFGSEYKAFEKLVGVRFTVDCDDTGESTALVLNDVKVQTPKQGERQPYHVRQQSCSLLVASKSGVQLENAIHHSTHPQLESFQ